MSRENYRIFSPGRIAGLALPNRLVRSATWDPCLFADFRMSAEVLAHYRRVAEGGCGLIITGGLPVCQEGPDGERRFFPEMQVQGIERLAQAVHAAAPDCRVVAQLETGRLSSGPSAVGSPFSTEVPHELSVEGIAAIVRAFAGGVIAMRAAGSDGVQLHAAHGSLLARFLSPVTNRRTDGYGGSPEARTRIVREIVQAARAEVGEFPILIKVNGTDYLEGGTDLASFPDAARAVEAAGVDAIEVSGGMWEALARPAAELGFRRTPSPEAHTRIPKPAEQSYFLPYAEALDLRIPVILVGGNRDVERLEAILLGGKVDFVALCRPLLAEPDLPRRWLEGRGKGGTQCISCNSCLYEMIVHPGRPHAGLVRCVFREEKGKYREAQEWLEGWVERNIIES
jgi:2,4-dienoyl-CoA reductase-like NADH-dependent reductase (Old Yellow Enzyme family)